MTRVEQAAKRAAKLQERAATAKRELATAQQQLREAERQDVHKRRYHVGGLAEHAGLFTWQDSDLDALFRVLARLAPCPDPVKVLEGLLADDVLVIAER
jgi:serine/threonine-protein kinase RIO1